MPFLPAFSHALPCHFIIIHTLTTKDEPDNFIENIGGIKYTRIVANHEEKR